jgi:hypothetical protein
MGKKTIANLEDLKAGMSARLASITSKLTTMDDLLTRLSRKTSPQNRARGKEQDHWWHDKQLEFGLKKADQYQRSWSVRVANVPLTSEENDSITVKKKVNDLALRPILVGAHQKGLISSVPDMDNLMEVAHILPANVGTVKPIITRFYNRYLRSVCLMLRKELAPRMARDQGGQGGCFGSGQDNRRWEACGDGLDGPRNYYFPGYEDLKRANILKMRQLSLHSRVQSYWTINGQLEFKPVNSANVYGVNSIVEPTELYSSSCSATMFPNYSKT